MQVRSDVPVYNPQPQRPAPLPVAPDDHALNLARGRLRLFLPSGVALAFPTDGSTFKIGRQPGSAVELNEPGVSRHHADGKWEKGQLWIRDKSTLGTIINGKPAEPGKWLPVPDGAQINLGGAKTPPLVLGVGGSDSIMMRIDQSQFASEADRFHLRTVDGRSLDIPSGKFLTVGRDAKSSLHLPASSTSRQHAKMVWHAGELLVQDLGSTYGTFVNGTKVSPKEWVTVPKGGQIQFGADERSRITLEAKPPLVVTFFGDGSVPDIGGEVQAQPRRFERALSNHNANAVVRGMVAQGSVIKDAAHAAVPVVAGGMGVAGVVALGAGIVAAAAGGPLAIPLILWGATASGGGAWGAWAGRHLFKGGLTAIKEKLKKDPAEQVKAWRHVQRVVVTQGPKIKQFRDLWKQNLAAWPTSRHIVFVSGHGDQNGAAGIKFSDIGKTVQGAEAIFLDACNGAQIESLGKLTGSAKVAVASEHTVRGYGFPLDPMFGRKQFPGDARALGAALVQAANQSQPSKSLVAVDLQALKNDLMPGLDSLGKGLQRLESQGFKQAIKVALNKSETTNGNTFNKKVDLGSFLANLAKTPGVSQACPELAAAETAFNKTILSMMGHGTISFDRRPSSGDVPEGWRQFLKDLARNNFPDSPYPLSNTD